MSLIRYLVVKSWNFIKDDRLRLKLYGYGDPTYEKYVRQLISQNKNKNKINISFRKNINKFKVYNNNSILILPTYSESFGLVILESLLSGNIVITSNFTPWNFIKNNSLVHFTNLNPVSISKKINQILKIKKNNNFIKDYKSIKKLIIKNYTWKRISKKYIKIINNL